MFLPRIRDFARRGDVAVAFVQPVGRTQERRLAAAGGPDQRGNEPLPDIDLDVLERLEIPVPEVQALGLDAVGERAARRLVIRSALARSRTSSGAEGAPRR